MVTGLISVMQMQWIGGVYVRLAKERSGTTIEKYTGESERGMRTLLVARDYLFSIDVQRFEFCYEKSKEPAIVCGATGFGQHEIVVFSPFTTDRGVLLTLTEGFLNGTKMVGSAFGYAVEIVDFNDGFFGDLVIGAPFEHRFDSDGHFSRVAHIHYLQSVERNKVWLDEQCERSGTTFYKRSSYDEGKSYSLRCNRAGAYKKKTCTRATSSKKDVASCPCFINVHIKSEDNVEVQGCFGHVGHDVEPALLRLTHTQEQVLRGLLEGFLHKNDMNSLMLRESQKNPDDGFRLLNISNDQSGKGFHLVIITPTQIDWLKKYSRRGIAVDDTHNITRYCLKLATVTVADDKDRGLPAAFLLSGTMTSEDVRILFTEIKKLVPEFDPLQIVTDEAPCFVNAFRMTFPNSKARLHYCRWHIDQTFKRATTRLVEVAHLRSRITKDLHDLLSINDLSTFEEKFAQILAFLEVEGQRAMIQYLKDNYLGRTRSWASFANKGVLDTTMISERWHLRLKQDFLQRNANSRADFLVDLLIRAVEDIADTTEIRDRRRSANASYRVQETTKCHRWAMTYMGKGKRISRSLKKGSGNFKERPPMKST